MPMTLWHIYSSSGWIFFRRKIWEVGEQGKGNFFPPMLWHVQFCWILPTCKCNHEDRWDILFPWRIYSHEHFFVGMWTLVRTMLNQKKKGTVMESFSIILPSLPFHPQEKKIPQRICSTFQESWLLFCFSKFWTL